MANRQLRDFQKGKELIEGWGGAIKQAGFGGGDGKANLGLMLKAFGGGQGMQVAKPVGDAYYDKEAGAMVAQPGALSETQEAKLNQFAQVAALAQKDPEAANIFAEALLNTKKPQTKSIYGEY